MMLRGKNMGTFARWMPLSLLMGVSVILLSAGHCPPKYTAEPPEARPFCPSLSDKQFEKCGCHPRVAATIDILQATNLPQNTRRKLERCLEHGSGLSVSIRDSELGSVEGTLAGCVREEIEINSEVQRAVNEIALRIVERAAGEREICAWQNCAYGRQDECF